jgi:hypothetical protein
MDSVQHDVMSVPLNVIQNYNSYLPKYPKIEFSDMSNGTVYHFTPQDDITPLESVRIAELFSYGLGVKGGILWLEYIKNNKLDRHFTKRYFGEDL